MVWELILGEKEGTSQIKPMKYLFTDNFAEYVMQLVELGILSAQ